MVATILIVMTLSPALTVLESVGHDGGCNIRHDRVLHSLWASRFVFPDGRLLRE
jgi:hypothetical protein